MGFFGSQSPAVDERTPCLRRKSGPNVSANATSPTIRHDGSRRRFCFTAKTETSMVSGSRFQRVRGAWAEPSQAKRHPFEKSMARFSTPAGKIMALKERRSILCPSCRKLINQDERYCPYCGTSRPGAPWKSNPWTRALVNPEQLVWTIIYVNIGMYILSLILYPSAASLAMNPFLFLSPSNNSLLILGATGTAPIDYYGRWWTLLSANYLHGGVLHIAFNMLALRNIGPMVAEEYGTNRFIIIYTVTGVAGFLLSYLAGVRFTIGASAALFGIIGAAIYYGKSRGGQYGTAVYKQLATWVVALFIFGFLVPAINNWAHGGGLLAGVILGFVLRYNDQSRETLFHKVLAGICVAVTALILVWAIGSGAYIRFTSPMPQ